ncbi:thiolase family protein [Candidatus Nucleicultrix amoebiphila]|jgi:acetyl-CoA acyltransferase|uniref:Acetyl-CoA acetyltransferase n=1 Tax=Candidatus Nucleicultrix amoebiphila FS5 TaxID=1414854 RepID=A0A1W6N2Y5_9PROT|nr:thiolase family protein [Candidatus Nucleicultrix amoebiphila]ARN84215.1 acetyl-CoA acetyltransferase [Candidatus Nucleicultrix amoebiphila FS5]
MSLSKNVVICGYARSPFDFANKGALIKVRPDDLAAQVIKALLERTKVRKEDIEDVLMGCAFPEGEQGLNVARLISFIADVPLTAGGATINRFCGSSMQSIHTAAGAINCNAGEVFVCAGIESMTRVPMGGYNPMPNPDLYEKMPEAYMSMGDTAENVAKKYNISRADQEKLAVESHRKAAEAQSSGRLSDEIIPIKFRDQLIEKDGCIRPETTAEVLASLKPAFEEGGSVTAGTSSPLTDGAAAVLVCSEDYAKKNNLPMLARIKSFAVAGCAPEIMGIGPVAASKKALERAGLTINDIDIIELNEAFASQALACVHDLGIDMKKINIDGGAIALGHPLGATGARITGKAASLLKREGKKYALATQCIGGGQGIATILEAI